MKPYLLTLELDELVSNECFRLDHVFAQQSLISNQLNTVVYCTPFESSTVLQKILKKNTDCIRKPLNK